MNFLSFSRFTENNWSENINGGNEEITEAEVQEVDIPQGQDFMSNLITTSEKYDNKVYDGFAIYGYEDGVEVKLMDTEWPDIASLSLRTKRLKRI